MRVEYSKTKVVPASIHDFEDPAVYEGRYYHVDPEVRELPDGRVRLKAVSNTGDLEVGTITFPLGGDQAEIEWHDRDPDDE